jgi:hypothetical protein
MGVSGVGIIESVMIQIKDQDDFGGRWFERSDQQRIPYSRNQKCEDH